MIALTRHEYLLRGLENLGNTCYLNSSLQLLASSKPFLECLCSCKFCLDEDDEGHLQQSCRFVLSLIEVIESICGFVEVPFLGITFKPCIMSFSIHSFCLTFTELDKSFDDDDQHVGKSWNTQK